MGLMPVETRDPRTYAIIGACMEVYNELGCGFLEAAYKQAMAIEFQSRGIPCAREVGCTISYKGTALDCSYRADFICFGEVIVEVKAVRQLTSIDRAQTINYLKATGLSKALLINYGGPSLDYERVVLSVHQKSKVIAE